jgi:hypothetical protein
LLIAGGILAIVGGVLGFVYIAAAGAYFLATFDGTDTALSFGDFSNTLVLSGIVALLGSAEILGGILALRRRRFRFALAGAIFGILCWPSTICGILATILIAMSKKDFKRERSQVQERVA